MCCGCPYILPHSSPFAEGSKAGAPTPRPVSLPCWYQGRYLICSSLLLSVFYYIDFLPFSSGFVLFFFFSPDREGGFPSYCPLPPVLGGSILGSKCARARDEGLYIKTTEYTSHIGRKGVVFNPCSPLTCFRGHPGMEEFFQTLYTKYYKILRFQCGVRVAAIIFTDTQLKSIYLG